MVKVIHNKSLYLLILAGLVFPASNAFADGNTTDFSITVNPSVSLSVSSASVNFEITPTMQGTYNSANFTVTSATNNVYGYTLTMSTNNVNLTSNTVNPNTGTTPTIPTLTETQDGITAAQFEASTDSSVLNHYGVAIGANNYNAMKASDQVKKTIANNTTADTTTINLASKLDLLTVPGVYSTTLNFQIAANPLPGGLEEAYQSAGKSKKTINGKQYYAMQDMSPAICSNATAVGDVIEVYDSRDDTIYHIGKLADDRCWLLDNLAINLLDTNVQNAMYDSGDPTHNTMTNATNEQIGYLFNGGRDEYDSSTDSLPTSGLANWTTDNISFSVPLINMSNKDIVPGVAYYGTDDPMRAQVEAGGWKVGGHYNYCAASAGSYCYGNGSDSGTSVDKQDTAIDAEYDICPSGWRMPTGGNFDETDHPDGGEYQTIYDAYPTIGGGDSQYVRVRKALRLPLSGHYYGGEHDFYGAYGYFWSSTRQDNRYMLGVSIDDGDFEMPFLDPTRYEGISVRCIAKTGNEPAPSGN